MCERESVCVRVSICITCASVGVQICVNASVYMLSIQYDTYVSLRVSLNDPHTWDD